MKLFSFLFLSCLLSVQAIAAEFSVTPEALATEINNRKTKVIEFEQLRDYGKAHNIRIWVAGGSAAGLAHYVKNDMQNEFLKSQGEEPIYFEGRFGYNYFDIYRSTQDCDVIIDGDEAQAQELETFIKKKFYYLQGSKEVFEVRLLDKPRGDGVGEKDALLNNPDFLNQHTDSHSTGMIELTQPPVTESVVRDLFDWQNQKNPKFLLDVVDNQLSYYFNDKHNTTKRFMDGINPPIISVLRYYTKLFQYGLKPRPEDEKFLAKIINAFDPRDPAWKESYVNKQINKNGIKMIRHALDMEFAIDTITRVGLKNKLIDFTSNGEEQVSWWVNKEPLRSFPVGLKSGKTAKELGITIVAHETKDFLAYESITMSRRGVPNVFISRENFAKENAMFGNGFYTKIGEEGALGTGITIRYTVDPNAVDGVDFIYIRDKNFVIFQNRNALRVIDESIEFSPSEYFDFLLKQGINPSDRGVWRKIELKVKSEIMSISKTQLDQVYEVIADHVGQFVAGKKLKILNQWVEMGYAHKYPQLFDKIFEGIRTNRDVLEEFFKMVSESIQVDDWNNVLERWFEKMDSMDCTLSSNVDPYFLLVRVGHHTKGRTVSKEEERYLANSIKQELATEKVQWDYFGRWLRLSCSANYPDLLLKLIDEDIYNQMIFEYFITLPWWNNHPKIFSLLKRIVKADMTGKNDYFIAKMFGALNWKPSGKRKSISSSSWDLFGSGDSPEDVLIAMVKREAMTISEGVYVIKILKYGRNDAWATDGIGMDLLKYIIKKKRNGASSVLREGILEKKAWISLRGSVELFEAILAKKDDANLMQILTTLSQTQDWIDHPAWKLLICKSILAKKQEYTSSFASVMALKAITENEFFINLCGGERVTVDGIYRALINRPDVLKELECSLRLR